MSGDGDRLRRALRPGRIIKSTYGASPEELIIYIKTIPRLGQQSRPSVNFKHRQTASKMSLPVTSININYVEEKGRFSFWYFRIPCLIFPDKIRNFLSTFKSSREDLAQDFANIGIDDDDVPPAARTSLKYMHQLVRVVLLFDASLGLLTLNLATGCKSWSTNACDWLEGYFDGAMDAIPMKWFWPLFSMILNLYLAYKTILADMSVFSARLLTRSCHNQRKTLATRMRLSMLFYIKGVNAMSS